MIVNISFLGLALWQFMIQTSDATGCKETDSSFGDYTRLFYFYATILGLLITLAVINIFKAKQMTSHAVQSRDSLLKAYKKAINEPLDDETHNAHFMPDFMIPQVRHKLTLGSFVGISYVIASFGFALFCMLHKEWLAFNPFNNNVCSFTSDKEWITMNTPFSLHLQLIALASIVMLTMFAILTVWKISMILSFALCPLFKYKVTKRILGDSHFYPCMSSDVKVSEKTKRFREEMQKYKQQRHLQIDELEL
jgi:hypothetical protein